MLLASHQVSEVERVADMVVILLDGRLVCIEHLDELKRSTHEVVLTLPDAVSVPPDVPGHILAHVPRCHEHVWMVRELDADRLRETCTAAELPAPVIRRPNLEDILLAILREYRADDHSFQTEPSAGSTAAAGRLGRSEELS